MIGLIYRVTEEAVELPLTIALFTVNFVISITIKSSMYVRQFRAILLF